MAAFLPGAHRDPRIDDSTYWVTRLIHTPADFELGNEKLYVKGACALGNTLSIDIHVTTLTLGPNRIGPEGALGLADGIARNRGRLSEFSILDGNEIGPSGCKSLVAAVKRNPRINSFSIYDTSIKKEGELFIAHALAELGGLCPNFEGFPLSKYCATVFGFPTSYDKKNNAELLFLLRGRPAVVTRQTLSFGDTGPSHSDQYDADDYDDDNFITVHISDGSYSSPLDTQTVNRSLSESPNKRAVPLPRHGRPIQPSRVPASPSKLQPPKPISNPFTSGSAAEGTAIRSLEQNRDYTIQLPK